LKLETGKPVRLVIQADQASDFDLMSPLLSITAEAGVSKLEFAVEQVEKAL
jgi:biopolymer transport protein ExbD